MNCSKRLRDVVLCILTRVYTFARESKRPNMNTDSLFPFIIKEYKNHLRKDLPLHDSFHAFCKKKHVLPRSAVQWMKRHGLDVGRIRYDIVQEKCNVGDKEGALSLIGERRRPVFVKEPGMKSPRYIPLDRRMIGVTITFTDGTSVVVKETTSAALNAFIKSYNQALDMNYVRIK